MNTKYIEILPRSAGGMQGVQYIGSRVFGLATGIRIFMDAFGIASYTLHKAVKILRIGQLSQKICINECKKVVHAF